MKSLKIISSFTFIAGTLLLLEGCSMDRNLSSAILCEDRMCTMNSKIELDQSDVEEIQALQGPGISEKVGSQKVVSQGVSAQGLVDNVLSLTPTMTLVGTIDPPFVNGTQVQASDITISGSKVYVAYNTQGEIQAGAVDVIDISSPTAASLASQALYPTTDIHKVVVNSGKLYAAGANTNGALLQRINLDSSGKLTSTVASVPLTGSGVDNTAYAGVSVAVTSTNIYAVSGSNGGLSVLNPTTMAQTNYLAIPDARDVSVTSSSVYVVTGKTNANEALLKKYNLALSTVTNMNMSGAALNDEGKSTILTGTNMQVVTAGEGGTRVICLSTGAVLAATVNPAALTTLTSAERAANAATFGAGYMFVANGEAGVAVYSVNVPLLNLGACTLNSLTYLGRFTLGTDASANNVSYSNGYLVVATGSKGFKIIKVTTSLLSGLLQAL